MTGALKPDIYRIIVKLAAESAGCTDDEEEGRLARQQCLYDLMKVSKAIHTIAGLQLYRDCAPESLFFEQTHTLRLRSIQEQYPASYRDLVFGKDAWTSIGKTRIGNAQNGNETRVKRMTEAAELPISRLHRALQVGIEVFPRLTKVVMMERDLGLLRHSELHRPEGDDAAYEEGAGPFSFLPLTLINQPSVNHYCQSNFGGPYELSNLVIKPTRSPRTVTFHPKDAKALWTTRYQLPIVIGSINRYVAPKCQRLQVRVGHVILNNPDVDSLFSPLMWMLSRDFIYVQDGESVSGIDAEGISLNTTFIEIYNFVRLEMVDTDGNKIEEGDLAEIQRLLDSRLVDWGWRGNVVLKDRESCDPCAACGKTFG